MEKYKNFKPTGFDPPGYFLEDKQEWFVVPVGQNRDSGELAESNFKTALEMLGGESDSVEVHRFGHWGPGWFEIIIVDNNSPEKVKILEQIEFSLENYPILDEEDFYQRESNSYYEGWNNYGESDFRDTIYSLFCDEAPRCVDLINAISNEELLEIYENQISSGEYYISESNGIFIPAEETAKKIGRDDLAHIIRKLRSK